MSVLWYRFSRSNQLLQAQRELQLQELRDQAQQAESRLQKTKDLHSLLLHHAGQGIFGVADDGRIIFTNPAAENIIGFSREEMSGIKMHPLIHHQTVIAHRWMSSTAQLRAPLGLTPWELF